MITLKNLMNKVTINSKIKKDWDENKLKEDVDIKQWQENWEDEIEDHFETNLKAEIENYKKLVK